jgi:hypothetical protein
MTSPRATSPLSPYIAAAFLALSAAGAGCDRTTMGQKHGRAYHEAFARQAVDPTAGERPRNPRAFQGLDSQEAAIVAKTYRVGLAPKEGGGDYNTNAPMLLMAPQRGERDTNNMPPPSVPDR